MKVKKKNNKTMIIIITVAVVAVVGFIAWKKGLFAKLFKKKVTA